MASKAFKADNNEVVNGDDSKANKTIMNSFNKLKNNKSRKSIRMPNIGATKEFTFLTSNTKKAFN